MAYWPGFCPDADARWIRAKRPGRPLRGLSAGTPAAAIHDPTYPQSAVNQSRHPTKVAKAALDVIVAKKKAEKKQAESPIGDPPPEQLNSIEVGNRNKLADGETTPLNHHMVAQALRFVPGGRTTFTNYVRRAMLNGDPAAKEWWKIYSDLTLAQQARIDFDDVCAGAGVTPDQIMGIVVSTAMRVGTDVGDLVAATMHPTVVQRTIKSALRIGGEYADVAQKDREMLFQHQRFIPTPKGMAVHVHASAQAAAAASNEPSVPSFAESLDEARASQSAIQRQISDQAVVDAELAE